MPSLERKVRQVIDSRKRKLDSYFQRADDKALPEELMADLSKFGAVLVCGYVEKCVEIIILERLDRRAHPRVLSFLKTHFRRGTNYNCKAISELLERFDTNWARDFRDFCDANERHAASLDSAYALRNSIAHGGDANRGMKGIKELYNSAHAVVEALVQATRA
jgi:hypothetical protein